MNIIQNILLGFSLSMDACAVSMSNGLVEPDMKIKKSIFSSAMFGIFQGLMPLIGFLLGSIFKKWIENAVPLISFVLLLIIGGKMILESFKKEENNIKKITIKTICVQTIATSIDALSLGITFVGSSNKDAYIAFLMIAGITFLMCIIASFIGKKLGDKLSSKSEILGGVILIGIGIKILIEYIM